MTILGTTIAFEDLLSPSFFAVLSSLHQNRPCLRADMTTHQDLAAVVGAEGTRVAGELGLTT